MIPNILESLPILTIKSLHEYIKIIAIRLDGRIFPRFDIKFGTFL